MKNYLVFLVGILLMIGIQSCTTVYNIGTDGSAQQKSFVQDDLYDEQTVFATKTKRNKKSDYYTPSESADEIIIEEEEGVSRQSFLNSRSVYSNYDNGYSDGFRNGMFSSMSWNNWYSNPFVNFGYSPFRSGMSIMLGINNFYYPPTFFPSFNSILAFNTFNPWYDPFFSPYGGFYGYMPRVGGFYPGVFTGVVNPYNPYTYLGGNGVNGGNYVERDRPNRVVRGPRNDGAGNRYNESYSSGGRNTTNQYNGSYNNKQTQVSPSQQRNVVQEYQRSQQRRNSNIEYSRPSGNDSYYQNRSSNYSNYNSSGSSGGYSGGGGGGGYSGGGSRGPR